jgi:exonuclease SbcD
MRLLHTGDWHVGKTIRGRSRSEEFEAAVAEVVGIAIAEKVDGVLLSGDLYDQRAVTWEADGVVFDALLELHAAKIPVVAIPGNHDSAARFDVLARLLQRVGVSMVARVRRPDEGGAVEVPARDGSHAALVCCLPFVAERRFSDASALFEDPAVLVGDYDEKMGALLEAMSGSFRADRVNVVMGHLFVDGARIGGGEREVTIGPNYAVSPARIPKDATYVALGHIHRPQQMSACPAPTYYCGSLLQLDFGERDQDKSVYVVDAVPGKPAKVTQIKLSSGRRLVDLPEAALDDLPALSEGLEDAYLRVHVKTDGPVPGIADRVRELLPNALEVHLSYQRLDAAEERPSLRGLEPRAQFLSYYESAHGAEPTDEVMAAFDRVYEEAQAS